MSSPVSFRAQLGRPLALDADIPDHAAFPLYAPAFTLDVPAGTAPDQNTDAGLAHAERVFTCAADAIRARMEGAGARQPP